jgi:FkbM family methyltransferase
MSRAVLPLAAHALSVRRWTVRRGEATGLRIATGGSNPAYVFGVSEPHVQRTIVETLQSGMVFFDVGANVGFFTLIGARAVGPTGRVYAFEPNPAAREILEENIVANHLEDRIAVLPWALGDVPVKGMLLTRNLFTAHLAPHGDLEVEVRRLDDLDLPHPDLVKIDVEGSEESVIRGMRQLLAHEPPHLIVETHDDSKQVARILQEAGYTVVRPEGEGMPHLVAHPGRTDGLLPE